MPRKLIVWNERYVS